MSSENASAMDQLFDGDEVRDVLRADFYGAPAEAKRRRRSRRAPTSAAPDDKSYKVLCISMYKTDLARLDAEVQRLKANGHPKISRSGLIRFALDQMDTSKLPKSY